MTFLIATPSAAARTARAPIRIPPQDDPPALGRYMPALDGLRGIAVLAVMMMHFSYWYLGALPLTRLGRIYVRATANGWMGVDLFFVLSGFLITGILLDSKGSPRYFRNFYARRTLRIFPLYYGVLAVVFLVLPLTPAAGASFAAARSHQAWFWLYGTNFAVYWHGWGYLDPHPITLTHFWSLAVEEHFYLVWPLVVYLSSRRGLVRISLLVIGTALLSRYLMFPHSHQGTSNLLTFCRMDQLAIGGLLALACRACRADQILAVLRPAGICAAFFLVGQHMTHSVLFHNKISYVLDGTVLGIFFCWLVGEGALANARSVVMPWLGRSALATLGRYSYGVYVFHQVLNRIIYQSIGTRLPHLAPVPSTILYSCTAGAISVAVAAASFHCYEKWFLNLKRKFPAQAPADAVPTGRNARSRLIHA
jgi:peptidoglycan/LPS O-acetylase OafA/YrhL